MNNLEKIKRHLSKPISISLKNESGDEDIFEFKPLNIEQQALLMEISKRMNSREKVEVEGKEVPDVKKEDMVEMFKLILDIVRESMPELEGDMLTDFVNTNFDQLSEKLSDLMPKYKESSALEKIKKKQEEYKDARKPGNK